MVCLGWAPQHIPWGKQKRVCFYRTYHLEKSQVSHANIVKIYSTICPCAIVENTIIFVINERRISFFEYTFPKSAPKQFYSQNVKEEPKDNTDEQNIEDWGDGSEKCIHNNLNEINGKN